MNTPTVQQFRDAMAHLPAAVSIVTSCGTAGKVGMTISSVCSVTDSPATLLFCINQSSDLHDIIRQNGKVCVNVLNDQQTELAKHFAAMLDSSMEERFSWDIWQQGKTGQFALKEAISSLHGEIVATQAVGTHTIFIVQLNEIQTHPQTSLVYFARQFKSLAI
ncbi:MULTISPECIES: 4-hydroxyphenylacetate 3-monooxygenase, reductase component [Glaesserella]|uniref:4-hydroxyphenylacetate 3-monooxygenase reductase component n=1 Tax=Glaesserella australis TaxID=2094024 RepID=A0A328C093_9PAST|nr:MULTISPECIES: 4-hydroxyphenylacetate 3-monooxygenase, reductase component [Glaesserella]AUI66441.1 4-hydroxyphenylacetate 3-monooxygenase, reductase component [Glaesserella sp. 15-184]RAL19345.1 4-hydroxyphenylacetate 3-monooxygenase, reductase component [Glaesserella australis]